MPRLAFVISLFALTGCYDSIVVGAFDGSVDAPTTDVPGFDAPRFDAPGFDAPTFDAPTFDAPPRIDGGVSDAGRDTPPDFDAGFDGGPVDAGPFCDPDDCPVAAGPVCVDDDTLRVFGDAFCNDEAMCDLPIEDFTCDRGCSAGACVEVCGEWTTDVVSSSGRSAGTTSIGVGNSDVYIAYAEAISNELRLARYRAGVWGLETIGRPNIAATIAAIDVDREDTIAAIFSPPRSSGLRFSTRADEGAWSRNEVVPTAGGRLPATIALDDFGTPHIVHRNGGDLGYARRVDDRWQRLDLPGTAYAGPNSLAVDVQGGVPVVHIVTAILAPFPMLPTLGYAVRRGEGPFRQTTFEGRATEAAIAVNNRGVPHVVDFFGSNLRLRVLQPDGSWEETLNDVGTVGERPDAVFDELGRLHVSFRDISNRRLGYARRDPATAAWTVEIASEESGAGDDSSIGLGFGGVHISHQSDTSVDERQLYYTRRIDCGD